MEVSKKLQFNPIVQDVKKGAPRFYDGPIYWNYGCFPQTWEDPDAKTLSDSKGNPYKGDKYANTAACSPVMNADDCCYFLCAVTRSMPSK